jgi:hypothetical protein
VNRVVVHRAKNQSRLKFVKAVENQKLNVSVIQGMQLSLDGFFI